MTTPRLDKDGLDRDVKLNHLMLTSEQVEEYQLPRIPVKSSDKRKKLFEKSHGEGQVELDALEALRPGKFEWIVREAILQFRDEKLARKLLKTREDAETAVQEAWQERIKPHRETLGDVREQVEAVVEQYQERLEELSEEMAEELEPLRKRRDDILHAVQAEVEAVEVALPELPQPEVKPDEDGWLFDGSRDYLAQLSYYRAHQNGEDDPPEGDEEDDESRDEDEAA